MWTAPASMRSDSSNAAYVFDVKIDTDRPYSEASMISIASSTSSYTWIGATGPNISSDQTRLSDVTSVSTVGR